MDSDIKKQREALYGELGMNQTIAAMPEAEYVAMIPM